MDPRELSTFKSASAGFTEPLTVWDFLNYRGGLHMAVAFGALFWPQFVEHEGCVFLSERFSVEAYEQWSAELPTRRDLEQMINHVHLWDLFAFFTDQSGDDAFEQLGLLLAKTWRCALADRFPDRDFEVSFVSDGGYGPELSLWQV
jgi:hypothetical protein